MAKGAICAVEGCDKETWSRDYCRNHQHRFKKHGHPLAGPAGRGDPERWLRAHVGHADADSCLYWPFAHQGSRREGDGYGRMRIDGRYVYAHRLMCELAHGPAPSPKHEAAHNCGQGHLACVNPHHLRWDTTQGNADDRRLHGTENKGSRNGQAVLTEDDVRQIKAMLGAMSQRAIAKKFGVSRWAVTDIANGRRWAWLT